MDRPFLMGVSSSSSGVVVGSGAAGIDTYFNGEVCIGLLSKLTRRLTPIAFYQPYGGLIHRSIPPQSSVAFGFALRWTYLYSRNRLPL